MNPYKAFQVARLPEIRFGSGTLDELPAILASYGSRVLLVTGRQSLQATPRWPRLLDALREARLSWEQIIVSGEPSPELVDEAVAANHGTAFDVVAGIGGGSVLDAAKAIAGLLLPGGTALAWCNGAPDDARAELDVPAEFLQQSWKPEYLERLASALACGARW